jgi:hypothetical protein
VKFSTTTLQLGQRTGDQYAGRCISITCAIKSANRIRTVRGFGYMLVHADTGISMAMFQFKIGPCVTAAADNRAILVVCQLISVFWLWHESKEQVQLLVASAIETITTRSRWSMRCAKRSPACCAKPADHWSGAAALF